MSLRTSSTWRLAAIALFLVGALGMPGRTANTVAWMDDAIAFYEKGQYEKALRTFLKIKKVEPDNALAREYISRCTAKIAEGETGRRLQKAAEKAEAPSVTIEKNEPVPAWAAPAVKTSGTPQLKAKPRPKGRAAPAVPTLLLEKEKPTSPFLIKREQLVETYKARTLDKGAITTEWSGKRVEVIAFLNRLFLPFSDALAPDAIPALERTARDLRTKKDVIVVFRAVDSLTPAVRHQMLDLPARRASILFSYLMHSALDTHRNDDRPTFNAADLDD